MKKTIFLGLAIFSLAQIFSQPRYSMQGHKGRVNSVFVDTKAELSESAFYTAGDDGMLIRWTENSLGEHFQASQYKIKKAVPSPDGNEIAFYETDGGSHNSVVIWDTTAKKAKRIYNYKDEILSLTYSAQGTYLIVTTTATNGLFLYTAKTGKSYTKVRNTGLVVAWAKTGSSEKNIILYSQDGALVYYNLASGKLIQKVATEPNLENLVLFSKNKYIAGTKGNALCVVNAESGARIKAVATRTPQIFGNEEMLYYLDGDAEMLSVYTIRITEKGAKGPLIYKNIKNSDGINFSAAAKLEENLLLASEGGKIYQANLLKDNSVADLAVISNDTYKAVRDICSNKENIFILTDTKIIKASYKEGALKSIPNTRGFSKIEYANNMLVLQTENRADGVFALNANLQEEQEMLLFTPQTRVNKIRACTLRGKEGILEIENSKVNFYPLNASSDGSAQLQELYKGSGIQDAVVGQNNALFIAKTASSRPASAVILVNIKTGETVPVKIAGDIAYSLSIGENFVFGAMLTKSEGGYSSSIFSLDTKSLESKEILASPKEDAHASLLVLYPRLFTNMASNEINSINLKNGKKYSLKESVSLPEKITECDERLVVLNKDTSITWYGTQQPLPLANWYLDASGEIIEF